MLMLTGYQWRDTRWDKNCITAPT
ncbi:hypothetical protein M3J09_013716 [Ascochyta lentis]